MLTMTVSISECPPSDLSFSSALNTCLVHLFDAFSATLLLDPASIFLRESFKYVNQQEEAISSLGMDLWEITLAVKVWERVVA